MRYQTTFFILCLAYGASEGKMWIETLCGGWNHVLIWDLIFLGGVGSVDVMLWMYEWMYAVSSRPRLMLRWVNYVWVQYPPVLGLTLWWVMYVCCISSSSLDALESYVRMCAVSSCPYSSLQERSSEGKM